MSRIGKKPIKIPDQVEVKVSTEEISITGPKGSLRQALLPQISANLENGELKVLIKDEADREQRALWGLFRSLISNMVQGVTGGFTKQLEINGIGFKAAVSGQNLVLNVGYSHPVNYAIPADVSISVEKNVINVSGIDKQRVGQVAAEIRAIKKPEPYKGKGIKYLGEVIRRKAGKAVKGAEK